LVRADFLTVVLLPSDLGKGGKLSRLGFAVLDSIFLLFAVGLSNPSFIKALDILSLRLTIVFSAP
jgi:hypothetical protein